MIISNKKHFIFIHIPKTAGSSIFQALRIYNDAPDTNENRHLELKTICLRYAHLAFPSGNPRIGGRDHSDFLEPWKNFFKFAFVRNPWDRVVSMYFYRLGNQEIPPGLSFFDFVKNRRDYPFGMNREQIKLLLDDSGAMVMDFVGRFENLQKDWSEIQTRLGITAPLPRLKQTEHLHYRKYYNQELVDEVAGMYPRDIQEFGYQF